jgi:hypothetical protein
MVRLKDRQRQVPGGYQFFLPQLKWSAPKNFPSFTVLCDSLSAVVAANPFLAGKHHWPTERRALEDWVDLYNATLCQRMGWDDYITKGDEGVSVPKSMPPHQSQMLQSLRSAAGAAKALVAGAKTLIAWLDSGDPPVDRDVATARAVVCVACPHNNQGDLTSWFTIPASELIRRQIAKLQERAISTIHDEKLHLCDVCLCPLKLKVHTPKPYILSHLDPEVLAKLKAVPGCWVVNDSP